MIYFYCFNLHFLDQVGYRASFYIIIYHLYLLFGEVSNKVFGPFFFKFRMFIFLLLNFKGFLYILDNSPFTDICFPNIFYQSMAFFFLSVSSQCLCRADIFNFNEVQLLIFFFMDCPFDAISKCHYHHFSAFWLRSSVKCHYHNCGYLSFSPILSIV